ncbi:MAG TPA: YafY family protein [Bacillales bacterium]|nr:YafY family protein [Bacillales bacterium]
MRADRLISILLLLQSNGRMTAEQLAKKLEVSERTVYRDMDALSSAGIPVFADRGANGGWSLLEEYRTSLTGLKESEIQALFVSPSGQLIEDLGLTRTAEDARAKLLAALPEGYRHNGMDVWNRIHIDTSRWRQPQEQIASFETLKKAIWSNHRLTIDYERANGEKNTRTVDPLGLVAKGGTWYFIASKEGDIRTYRVSRIQSATLTEEPFERPEDFDLVQYWKASTKKFIKNLPKYEVHAEVAPAILPRLKFTGRFVQVNGIGEPNSKGWVPIKFSFDTKEEAKEYILGFGDQIKVVEPKTLQGEILEMAEAAVAFYKKLALRKSGSRS